jgi:hypothetical protein
VSCQSYLIDRTINRELKALGIKLSFDPLSGVAPVRSTVDLAICRGVNRGEKTLDGFGGRVPYAAHHHRFEFHAVSWVLVVASGEITQ